MAGLNTLRNWPLSRSSLKGPVACGCSWLRSKRSAQLVYAIDRSFRMTMVAVQNRNRNPGVTGDSFRISNPGVAYVQPNLLEALMIAETRSTPNILLLLCSTTAILMTLTGLAFLLRTHLLGTISPVPRLIGETDAISVALIFGGIAVALKTIEVRLRADRVSSLE